MPWIAFGAERTEDGCWLVLGSRRMEFLQDLYDDALFFRDELEENRAVLALAVAPEPR